MLIVGPCIRATIAGIATIGQQHLLGLEEPIAGPCVRATIAGITTIAAIATIAARAIIATRALIGSGAASDWPDSHATTPR